MTTKLRHFLQNKAEMHKNLQRTVQATTYGNVLQRTENNLKPLINIERKDLQRTPACVNECQNISTAEPSLSQFFIV